MKGRIWLFTIFLVAWQPGTTVYKTIGGKKVYDVAGKGVYVVTSGFMIDADGAPRAYHQDNARALDYLANAGRPGNWWALVTDNGKSTGRPLVQTAADPAPGYYISTTSLQDGTKNYKDPRRYVDSEKVPYLAIPPKFAKDFRLGDIGLVVNRKNGKRCYAIFADTGPAAKIGEGSICLAEALGIRSNPKNGGAASDIVYILIKNSGNGKVRPVPEIEAIGKSKLSEADIRALLQ